MYHSADLPIIITSPSTEVESTLRASGFIKRMGGFSFVYYNVHDAVRAVISGVASCESISRNPDANAEPSAIKAPESMFARLFCRRPFQLVPTLPATELPLLPLLGVSSNSDVQTAMASEPQEKPRPTSAASAAFANGAAVDRSLSVDRTPLLERGERQPQVQVRGPSRGVFGYGTA